MSCAWIRLLLSSIGSSSFVSRTCSVLIISIGVAIAVTKQPRDPPRCIVDSVRIPGTTSAFGTLSCC